VSTAANGLTLGSTDGEERNEYLYTKYLFTTPFWGRKK